MRIEDVRPSFTVYLIASELERFEGVAESLSLAGYLVATFSELTAAYSELASNPPHFLVFEATERQFDLAKAIKQAAVQLPESHVFLLTPLEHREQVVGLLEKGVYDLIYTPLVAPVEVLRALDRAAERDYFMYLNERLSEAAPQPVLHSSENAHVPAGAGVADEYVHDLFASKSLDDTLGVFLRASARTLNNAPCVLFRYIANRRVLLAAQGVNVEEEQIKGVGVDFNSTPNGFRAAQIAAPMDIRELRDLITEVFGTDLYVARPIVANGEAKGIVVWLAAEPQGADLRQLETELFLCGQALTLLEMERRLHVTNVKDAATDVLTRVHFNQRVEQEISRSRRVNMPVSLLTVALDQYGEIATQVGTEEAGIVLRMMARIIEKQSRVNDIIGRTGSDEFGIILPHTSQKGAAIKAERLRRLLASADFSKVLSAYPHVTVSIGISEYPSLVRDAQELQQTAEEALLHVRKAGNKTAVAQPPEGFVPDFSVKGAS